MIRLSRICTGRRCARVFSRTARPLSENMEERLKLFQGIGLSEQKAKETAKNEKLASNLEAIVHQVVPKIFR